MPNVLGFKIICNDIIKATTNMEKPKLLMLNLGCGSRFHRDWINVDFHPLNRDVMAHDLRKPLRFADNTFDVIYHSHILEHFSSIEGKIFLKECFRVCKPGGIIRIVVPDLEIIVRLYIHLLEHAIAGDYEAEIKYNWVIIGLLDQIVRTKSGGDMATFIRHASPELRNVIKDMMGHRLVDGIIRPSKNIGKLSRFKNITANKLLDIMRGNILRAVSFLLYGKQGIMFVNEAIFRNSGEIHKYMYDRFSLNKVLNDVGFSKFIIHTAKTSNIMRWQDYHLDTNPDGSVDKPDSLYCEASK